VSTVRCGHPSNGSAPDAPQGVGRIEGAQTPDATGFPAGGLLGVRRFVLFGDGRVQLAAHSQEEIAPQGGVFGSEERGRVQNGLEVVGALLGGCSVRPQFDSGTADDAGFLVIALLACVRVDDYVVQTVRWLTDTRQTYFFPPILTTAPAENAES
jgi:hypothetical protein